MERLRCYPNSNSTYYNENYDITNTANLDVTLVIEKGRITYTVASNTCTTTAFGDYITNFNGTSKSVIDFVNMNSASTCNISVLFTGNGVPGSTGDIKFALLPTHSSNLNWEISNTEKDRLELDFFTNFEGSSEVLFCNDDCSCVAGFDKI
jgi:hypothetical protein